jgi:hypothetical protein
VPYWGKDDGSASVPAPGRMYNNAMDDEDGWWSSSPECSWGHLLGLHRIMYAGRWRALELSPHGAGIPLLMWLAIQVLPMLAVALYSNSACAGV